MSSLNHTDSVSVTLPREAIVVEVTVAGLSSTAVVVAPLIVLLVVVELIVGALGDVITVVIVVVVKVTLASEEVVVVIEVVFVVVSSGSDVDELLLFVAIHGNVVTGNNWHASSCSSTCKHSD